MGIYELGPLLSAGGMGEVYRARDTKLGRDVAIKGPAFDEAHRIEMLLIDCALRQLVHGNDPGMLELPGDLRFSQESRSSGAAAGLIGLEFLEGHWRLDVR
jgi:serine/threonine protein kinase